MGPDPRSIIICRLVTMGSDYTVLACFQLKQQNLTLLLYKMSVARSQRFIYFQSKASHYNNLRNIKSSIDHSSPRKSIPKPKVYRPLPLLQQHHIQVQNQKLIERIVKITKSPRTQLQAQGCYSRYNKLERPFRSHNPLKEETERSITIDNSEMKQRLEQAKAVIGTKEYWNKQYSKSICCKKNLSKYLENNKSKAELHISTDRFVPQHLRDYALCANLDSSFSGKQATLSIDKLFALPQIERTSRVKLTFQELSNKSKQELSP